MTAGSHAHLTGVPRGAVFLMAAVVLSRSGGMVMESQYGAIERKRKKKEKSGRRSWRRRTLPQPPIHWTGVLFR